MTGPLQRPDNRVVGSLITSQSSTMFQQPLCLEGIDNCRLGLGLNRWYIDGVLQSLLLIANWWVQLEVVVQWGLGSSSLLSFGPMTQTTSKYFIRDLNQT